MDLALAVIIGKTSPVLMKIVPLKGVTMMIASWVLAFSLGLGDVYFTQGTSGFSPARLAMVYTIIYTIQQNVFSALQKNEPAAVQ